MTSAQSAAPPAAGGTATAPAAVLAELRITGPDRSLLRSRALDLTATVGSHVRRRAGADPDRPAVVQGDTTLTYAELDAWADGAAAALRSSGCAPGERVLVAGGRGPGTLVAFLALERIGALYVPLDATWSPGRIAEVAARTGATRVLTHGTWPDPSAFGAAGLTHHELTPPTGPYGTDGAGADGTATDGTATDGAGTDGAALRRAEPRTSVPADEPRYALYTAEFAGGTEGAVTAHAGMMNHLWGKAADLELHEDDRVAFSAPVVFDTALWQMLAPLLAGATVVVLTEADTGFPRRLAGALDRSRTTVVELVPETLRWLLGELERRGAERPCAALRWIIGTGGELAPALAARTRSVLPRARLIYANGPVECSDDVLHHVVREGDMAGADRLPRGRPIANAVISVLLPGPDGTWRHAEPGEQGELFVRGVPVGPGYLDDPAATARCFLRDISDGASPTGLAFRTGDLASLREGTVYHHGRVDRRILTDGHEVAPEDLELAMERLPGVRRAAVIPRAAVEENGNAPSAPRLTAFYTSDGQQSPPDESTALAGLPGGHLVARPWVRLTAMPLTRKGEIDHRALDAHRD
ncbi:AMP-binding protein [Streptomyces sp. NPDC003952]